MITLLASENKSCDPLLHFLCGFIGKGNGKDAVRLYAVAYQSCDAVGNDSGFSGSCSGENEQGTRQGFNGSGLGGV